MVTAAVLLILARAHAVETYSSCNAADAADASSCDAAGAAEVEDSALLSLRNQPPPPPPPPPGKPVSGPVSFGDKVVIASSPEDGFINGNWYGDSVAYVNPKKLMAFQPGGIVPPKFHLRPRGGVNASGCIKFGSQVVIAASTAAGYTKFGWYGGQVAAVDNREMTFKPGGENPESWYFLSSPPSPQKEGTCIEFGDQVVMSTAHDWQPQSTEVLYKTEDGLMGLGAAQFPPFFYLRSPAAGPGPMDLCKSLNTTVTVALARAMMRVNKKIHDSLDGKDPMHKEKKWWHLSFKGLGIFKKEWVNEAGWEVNATDFSKVNIDNNMSVTDCAPAGNNATFTAGGFMTLTWLDSVNSSLSIFYHGFVDWIDKLTPFHSEHEIDVDLTNMKLISELDLTFTTSLGNTSQACLSAGRISQCSLTADITVDGAPLLQKWVTDKVTSALKNASKGMCEGVTGYFQNNIPMCQNVR